MKEARELVFASNWIKFYQVAWLKEKKVSFFLNQGLQTGKRKSSNFGQKWNRTNFSKHFIRNTFEVSLKAKKYSKKTCILVGLFLHRFNYWFFLQRNFWKLPAFCKNTSAVGIGITLQGCFSQKFPLIIGAVPNIWKE